MGISPLLLTLETTFHSSKNTELESILSEKAGLAIKRQMLFPHKGKRGGLYKTLPQTKSLHTGQIGGFPFITLTLGLKGTGKFPPLVRQEILRSLSSFNC